MAEKQRIYKNMCRKACLEISAQLFPGTVPLELAAGDFEFVYIEKSDTLWLVYAHNMKTMTRAPKIKTTEDTSTVSRHGHIMNREATMEAMINRGVLLGSILKEFQRTVHEQRLLRDAEESRSFKRASMIMNVIEPQRPMGKKPDIQLPEELKNYLDKYHRLKDHYEEQIALIK